MNDQDLTDALDALAAPGAAPDVDPWRRENLRRHAHARLAAPPATPRPHPLRVLEPVLVTAFCGAHLLWGFLAAAEVLLR